MLSFKFIGMIGLNFMGAEGGPLFLFTRYNSYLELAALATSPALPRMFPEPLPVIFSSRFSNLFVISRL